MQQHEFSTVAPHSFKFRLGRSELCTIRCEVHSIQHICVVYTHTHTHTRNSLPRIGFRFQKRQEFFVVSISPGADLGIAKALNPPRL